ncbi:fimbria biosynthesis transcriptional regulator FimZ [Enterobacter sp. Ap-916]|jgi:two-component system response regulator FimZ (fimbrial Z protein)|uniref:fimbria biosynthesis transcriptional regulator FimZ n=1 Tax=Enterobacteriaceae TaxID=543 RepID=UPI000272A2EB|nr:MULTISPECIES: fimbria biosynthesis transcriptional regulator FimZ [Enterobacteriaceae]EJF29226.1 transcriptional regulator FimZ [Enterobacter sp. Ag1]NIF34331.1 fimbria biosynthesis transcriptional regulator FimZ [Enterobacter sp. Cy-643]NIF49438.1 fimbria biosynthesis transcriptional regulator FimZ [Enterobacter sp. Ap-1006]NIF60195.1 fimbria biosynthesis transcriptional regulator FimZ [Enterobacter sp. Ap-867]NIG31602.1 fimbria biosynthesis transcriptional regulator FimZ [Enterobacter sp.
MKPASVIIMDEHPIVRMSIEVLLQKNKDINVVLKTDDGREVIDYMRANPVDLVILDVELPNTDGFTLLKRIKGLQEKTKILFLSSKSESFYAGRAIQAGANGFVSKRKEQEDIFNAVEMLLSGYSFFPSETLHFISSHKSRRGTMDDMPLSNREITVLRYLANGLSNKEIAEQLLLSNKTISAHKANIFSKLGLTSIVELIDYAKVHELL